MRRSGQLGLCYRVLGTNLLLGHRVRCGRGLPNVGGRARVPRGRAESWPARDICTWSRRFPQDSRWIETMRYTSCNVTQRSSPAQLDRARWRNRAVARDFFQQHDRHVAAMLPIHRIVRCFRDPHGSVRGDFCDWVGDEVMTDLFGLVAVGVSGRRSSSSFGREDSKSQGETRHMLMLRFANDLLKLWWIVSSTQVRGRSERRYSGSGGQSGACKRRGRNIRDYACAVPECQTGGKCVIGQSARLPTVWTSPPLRSSASCPNLSFNRVIIVCDSP